MKGLLPMRINCVLVRFQLVVVYLVFDVYIGVSDCYGQWSTAWGSFPGSLPDGQFQS